MKRQRAGKIFLIFGIMLFSIFLVQAEEWGYDSRLIPSKVSTEITITQGNLTNFTQQLDTPSTYASHGDECVTVKNDETGLEFTSCASAGDTNETTRVNTIVGTNCGTGNYSYGFDSSGNIQCREDVSGSGGGNPFDQDLNISSNITHNDATFTGNVDISNNLTATNLFANLNWNFLFNKFSDGIDLVWLTVTGETLSINQTTLNATIDARAGGDNSSWNESYADTKYLQSYTETDPLWSDNFSLYNTTWSTNTDTTYSNGTGLSLNGSNFFSILLNYMLPQSCNNGEIAEYNTTSGGWDCAIDNSASSGMSNWILAVLGIGGSETITDGETVTLGSGNDYIEVSRTTNNINYTFNETRLNNTIDLRDSDTTYTHLTNFTDDLGHVEDNSSWNESHANDIYVNANGDNMTGPLEFQNSYIKNPNYIQFNTSWTDGQAEGRMQWSLDDGVPEVGLPGGTVNGQIFLENLRRVRANETITNGDIVYPCGGTANRLDICKADYSSIYTAGVNGIATEDIAESQFGYINAFGYVRDINTTGEFGFCADGSPAWLSNNGRFTCVPPTGNKIKTLVGVVITAHSTTGIMDTYTQLVPRLQGLSQVDGTNLINNSIVQYDSTSETFKMTTSPTFENITINDSINMVNFSIKRMDTNGASTGDLFAICMTGPSGECLPHLGIQPGGPGQGSFIARSLMIVDEEVSILNNTNRTDCQAWADHFGQPLKIDCNTTTTGADLFVGDDLQVNGDVWLLDSDGEFHFMTRELALNDELRDNTVTSKLNYTLINNNLTIIDSDGEQMVIITNENTTFNGLQDSISIQTGTNSSPQFNHIFYSGNPAVFSQATTRQDNKADVGEILMGANYSYGDIIGSATGSEFIRGVYRRFFDEGAIYQSGFDIQANSTTLNFSTGMLKVILNDFEITTAHSTDLTTIEIHNDGTFHQHINDLNGFDSYSDGGAVGNNRYFNMVCGIAVTSDGDGRLYCVPQNEPSSEHSSTTSAELEQTYLKFFPQDDFLKRIYIPIARIVIQRSGGVNTIQTLSTGFNFLDLRGTISSGGSPPTPGIDTHSDLLNLEFGDSGHTFLDAGQDMDIGSYNLSTTGWLRGMLNWSWLQNVPSLFDGLFTSLDFSGTTGFSDLVDNDTTYSSLSEFIDDLGDRGYTNNLNFSNGAGYYNSTNFDINDYSTTVEVLAFGYYNSTDFVITDYFTKSEVLGFNYYNSTDFDINDYLTSAQVLSFNYYNATDFDINDYFNSAEVLGFGYYNSTDFSISDYYTKTEINNFNYYNLTNFNINDYYLNSNPNSYYNSTNPQPITDVWVNTSGDTMTGNLAFGNNNVTLTGGTIHSNSTCIKLSGSTTDWEIC